MLVSFSFCFFLISLSSLFFSSASFIFVFSSLPLPLSHLLFFTSCYLFFKILSSPFLFFPSFKFPFFLLLILSISSPSFHWYFHSVPIFFFVCHSPFFSSPFSLSPLFFSPYPSSPFSLSPRPPAASPLLAPSLSVLPLSFWCILKTLSSLYLYLCFHSFALFFHLLFRFFFINFYLFVISFIPLSVSLTHSFIYFFLHFLFLFLYWPLSLFPPIYCIFHLPFLLSSSMWLFILPSLRLSIFLSVPGYLRYSTFFIYIFIALCLSLLSPISNSLFIHLL